MFGGMGVAFCLCLLFSLWSGAIYFTRGPVTYRSSEPFQFYTWIFLYALLATLFTAAGIYLFLHPEFSLAATTHGADD